MSRAGAERKTGATGVRRVLVAEDSSITQDLLKLVLTQRGYEVAIVNDGLQALQALRETGYDVALLDFHLPEMDGLQVVSNFLAENTTGFRPRFVAITADVEGLLSHPENCERFDKIVPKPVDIHEICNVIDEAGAQVETGRADPLSAPEDAAPELVPVGPDGEAPRPAAPLPAFLRDFSFLTWPDDFNAKHLSARALQASASDRMVDGILVRARADVDDLALIWKTKSLHLLPIVDLSGALGSKADIDCTRLSNEDSDRIAGLINAFHDRRTGLHKDLVLAEEIEDRLLGRLYVSDSALTPTRDGSVPTGVAYNVALDDLVVMREAAKLQASGMLDATFYDRMHVCGSCRSSRFNVREECSECRSPDLQEESYLHHFRCAYQGPESDFRRGDDLICPKCRKELLHFGRDYDRPGNLVVCNSCNQSTSEPFVGFVCLDCGDHIDGEVVRTRDVSTYTLTDQGLGYLEAGQSFLGFTQQSLRFSDLPLDLVVSLNEEARRYNEDGVPFALVDIGYQNERLIEREHGPRQFAQLRSLFLQNLRAEMVRDARIVRGTTYDFVLVTRASAAELRVEMDGVCRAATEHIRIDLGVTITIFGPEDLF